MHIPKYSIGVGDRFGFEGEAQLTAFIKAREAGVEITPVWNKSNREHKTIGSLPEDVRTEADSAVKALNWNAPYFVDADHINLSTVEPFIPYADFFTLDVAASIGTRAPDTDCADFVSRHRDLIGTHRLDGLATELSITEELLQEVADKYLFAIQEAKRIYERITADKGGDTFVTEVSMDETDSPQTPAELLLILAAIADAGIPAQTIAPRFSGRFNKGVEYVGNPAGFQQEFAADIAVISAAIARFGLPQNLKLSVHSGSDKFAIYPVIAAELKRTDAGIHLKTAGTTWLEEIIGLAEAGGEGLEIAKEIYRNALERFDELCGPYADVLDINTGNLPSAATADSWSADDFAAAIRHDQSNAAYNPDMRQLMHVGYKLAAEMGERYTQALRDNADVINRNVTDNLFERHIRPLFL